MYYWSFFPFCVAWYILIMKSLTSTKLSGFDQRSAYWRPVAFLPVFLNSKNSWYIWQYISRWKFLDELKSLRLVLGSVYVERVKSSMILCIFYKVSIFLVALDVFSFFYSKIVKLYQDFLFRINISFFKYILSVAA